MSDLTTMSPPEVDSLIAEQYQRLYALRIPDADVFHAAEAKRTYGRNPGWSMTFTEALAAAKAKVADESLAPWEKRYAQSAVETWEKYVATREAIHERIREYNAEFTRRGGWTRAFLVTDGHVHSSMACSTCNRGEYQTQFTWLTEFSGRTEAEVVEAAADRACTVCYPSAPVETAGPSALMTPDERTRAEQREAAAKAKAERQAKKIANGLTPDGSEFKVSYRGFRGETSTERFKTERAAVQWVVQYMVWGPHGQTDYTPAFEAVVEAVATKHGKTVEEVKAELNAKAAAKAKRDSTTVAAPLT